MRISYDAQARAFYFYFTDIRPGGVSETLPGILTEVELTDANRIAAFRLRDIDDFGETYFWGDKLHFVLREMLASYDQGYIKVSLTPSKVVKTLTSESNVDVDDEGQILGIEMLFADNILPPNEG